MELTLNLPDELFSVLGGPGADFSRAAFEAIALEAFREDIVFAVLERHGEVRATVVPNRRKPRYPGTRP
jgi:hypothetical protein